MQSIFISGIGTSVGKTLVSAIITEALQADYWKPIQTGITGETDSVVVQSLVSNTTSIVHNDGYRFTLTAPPHLAAREEGVVINLEKLERSSRHLSSVNDYLVIEGPGGILVPLNEKEFLSDFINQLDARVILVSRNYLGSINHSLLTAQYCKQKKINVLGWIFNDHFMDYADEIVAWTGYKKLASIPFSQNPSKEFVKEQAEILKSLLQPLL